MPVPVDRLRLPLLFSLFLFVFFSIPLANPGPIRALTSPISITSQTYFIHFPDYIDFTINASDATSTIAKATISITFGPQQDQEQNSGTVNAKPPGHSVRLQFKEDTTGDQFHPPGTPVSYY